MTTTELKAAPSVASLEAAAYTIPTGRPEGDGTLAWDSTTWVLAWVRSDDPALPYGLGWTYAPAAAVPVIHELLAGAVRGRDPLDVVGCWQAMVRAVRNAGRPGLVSMALSAVDTALWDLKARLLDVPLHHLFGAVRTAVPVYGSGGFTTDPVDHLRSQLRGWLEEGVPRMKMKIAESWGSRSARDLERVTVAREVVGDAAELFVDANGGYRTKQAVRIARQLDELGVTWFEEPVSSDDHDGLRTVQQATDLDVTAGEYGDSLAYFSHLLAARAVDCVQVDVTRCGGYTEWLRIASLAAASGLDVSGHCAPTLHLPMASATPNLRHLEWFEDHVRIERRFLEPFPSLDRGDVAPLESPGHGVAVRETDLAAYRVA